MICYATRIIKKRELLKKTLKFVMHQGPKLVLAIGVCPLNFKNVCIMIKNNLYLLQSSPSTFGKQGHSPVDLSHSNKGSSTRKVLFVPIPLQTHSSHDAPTAFPWYPGWQYSQCSPTVLKVHFRHIPESGSQFPCSDSIVFPLQLQGPQEPPTIFGLPKKLLSHSSHLLLVYMSLHSQMGSPVLVSRIHRSAKECPESMEPGQGQARH